MRNKDILKSIEAKIRCDYEDLREARAVIEANAGAFYTYCDAVKDRDESLKRLQVLAALQGGPEQATALAYDSAKAQKVREKTPLWLLLRELLYFTGTVQICKVRSFFREIGIEVSSQAVYSALKQHRKTFLVERSGGRKLISLRDILSPSFGNMGIKSLLDDNEVFRRISKSFEEFIGRIGVTQNCLLKALLSHYPKPKSDKWLRNLLELSDNRVLAGVLSGISKQALAVGIEPSDIYTPIVLYKLGRPQRKYKVTSEFSRVAEREGWPHIQTSEELLTGGEV